MHCSSGLLQQDETDRTTWETHLLAAWNQTFIIRVPVSLFPVLLRGMASLQSRRERDRGQRRVVGVGSREEGERGEEEKAYSLSDHRGRGHINSALCVLWCLYCMAASLSILHSGFHFLQSIHCKHRLHNSTSPRILQVCVWLRSTGAL